jgi:hypothetical protein
MTPATPPRVLSIPADEDEPSALVDDKACRPPTPTRFVIWCRTCKRRCEDEVPFAIICRPCWRRTVATVALDAPDAPGVA